MTERKSSIAWICKSLHLPILERSPGNSPASVLADRTAEGEKPEKPDVPRALQSTTVVAQSKLGDSLSSVSRDVELWTMKQTEIEQAFQIAVDMALGATSLEPHRKDVEAYINKAFSLPEETKTGLWQKAQAKQHSGLKLCGKLISARDIPAMDANGKSDPYCVVGIISENDRGSESVKHHTKLKKDDIFTSTIKMATLEPVWNEKFELPIHDRAGEVLLIEVWDSDKQVVGASEIKGLKGLGIYVKDLKPHTDDFIGRAFLNLKDTPPQGAHLTLELYSHTTKHHRGIISVYLSIKGQEEGNVSLATKLDQYMLLIKALVMHEAKKDDKSFQRHWSAEMSDKAKGLLFLHASYYGVSGLQQAAIHLSVLFDYHMVLGIQPYQLLRLLDSYQKLLPKTTASTDSSSEMPIDQVDKLLGVLERLHTEVFRVLCNHLILMDMTSTSGVESLTWWIQIMMKLYQLDDLVARLPADRRCLKTTLEASIQSSISKWYMVSAENASLGSKGSTVSKLKALSESCLSLCETIQKSIQPAVKKLADVDYLVCYFASMDKQLSPAVIECLEGWSSLDKEASSTVYVIYLNIKQMCDIAKLAGNDQRELQLLSYQRWFKNMVPVWMKVAFVSCKERIDKAVQADKFVSITNEVGYSSSLVDSLTFLYQMVDFWHHLGWTSADEIDAILTDLVKYITEAASYYVEQIYTQACNIGQHTSTRRPSHTPADKDKYQFHVNTQFCVLLNNVQHMQQSLLPQLPVPSPHKPQLTMSFDWIQKEKYVGDQTKKVVLGIVARGSDEMQQKISNMGRQLGEQFIPTIQNFIAEMLRVDEGIKTEQALVPLEDYLNTNLKTLSSNLLLSVFKILLEHIWIATVDALGKSVSTIPKKPNQRYLYQRLHDALLFLNGFFNAGGKGLTGERLDTSQYKALLDQLELMCLSTRDLVLRCCADLAEQQAKAVGSPEHKLGELTLSVGYLKEKAVVEVAVVKGDNLPAIDKNGYSDPYVEIALLPSSHKKVKTHVIKHTLNPVFNEELLLPVLQDERGESAILVLGVYDHEIVGKNDFMGICVIPYKEIPQISNTASLLNESAAERRNVTLPLFHIEDSRALQEVTQRHHCSHDHEATTFSRLLKHNYKPRGEHGLLSKIGLIAPHLLS